MITLTAAGFSSSYFIHSISGTPPDEIITRERDSSYSCTCGKTGINNPLVHGYWGHGCSTLRKGGVIHLLDAISAALWEGNKLCVDCQRPFEGPGTGCPDCQALALSILRRGQGVSC